ncbi:protein WEAK CHLOROPLAST MOVEMENT UNDER BLUE LIGHT-like 1 [Curcuma longa]|uniref:protein WEAK CHLOROPLAST MOVEMENT UNDER BLUE LIGHT-like 1 n=1 Tax=Curcuma longa TaxID=136217 RepID=UPI003D9E4E1C
MQLEEGEEEGAKHGEIRNHDDLLGTPTQFAFPTPCSAYEPNESETLKKEATEKFDDMERILVDTAAPFESVREAVSKFGGIVDCKAEERLNIEKQKQIQLELKQVQEEVLQHRKRFQDEETAKAQVLEELDCCKGLVEELNLRLEREATLEKQAKQDCELADMRLREAEQGITDDSSVASKAQMDVANERHASAVVELKSVKEEFESIQSAYAALLPERDIAIEKAAASLAAFKEIKRTIQKLALKLIITKQLLESVHVVRLKSEDQILVAALELEIEKLVWDKLLKHAEEELQQVTEQILMTNTMKLELDRNSTLLANLKAELALQNQAISVENTQGANCLKIQLSSLLSELGREKASLSSMREREDLKSASITSLEAELKRMNTELELVLKEEGAGDKMTGEEQAKLLQAAKEAEEAKFLANLARKALEEKKKKLREAMARAEKAEEERHLMEQELKAYKEKHKHEPTTRVGSFDGSMDIGAAGETTSSFGEAAGGSQCESSTRSIGGVVVRSDNQIVPKPKPKRRKRMFFARILLFLARKKVQSLK